MSVSQPWDAGSDADRIVTIYTSDANGTLMALVELGKVPADGTWEVLNGSGYGWRLRVGDASTVHYRDGALLVVARPIGSGE